METSHTSSGNKTGHNEYAYYIQIVVFLGVVPCRNVDGFKYLYTVSKMSLRMSSDSDINYYNIIMLSDYGFAYFNMYIFIVDEKTKKFRTEWQQAFPEFHLSFIVNTVEMMS